MSIMINNLFNKYQLSLDEQKELLAIIKPIYNHIEFKKRSKKPFHHHGIITLGEHIIEDAIVTFKLSKKYLKKHNNYSLKLAVIIAMFHDLYEMPWQNNKIAKTKSFFNRHGFRHPYEAITNAINWYPEYFQDENDANVIIDGVLHHMAPLPIKVIKGSNFKQLQLNNYKLIDNISDNLKQIIINSSRRKKIFFLSFTKSKRKEGRIMAKSDRLVTIFQIGTFRNAIALLSGRNKKIK